jgi:hypothetical protein
MLEQKRQRFAGIGMIFDEQDIAAVHLKTPRSADA